MASSSGTGTGTDKKVIEKILSVPEGLPIVLVDFSGVVFASWESAMSAFSSSITPYYEHVDSCTACNENDGECQEGSRLHKQAYDVYDVFKNNIFNSINSIVNSVKSPAKTWAFIKDGKEVKRYELYPGYKANREKKRINPRPIAEKYLKSAGFDNFFVAKDSEADDAIATLVDLIPKDRKIVIVSSDKDLWQLWGGNVSVYSPTQKFWLNESIIRHKFNSSDPKHIRLFKAIWGDRSDNIPNVMPRMQKYLLPFILKSDGSLEDFVKLVNENSHLLSHRCNELVFVGKDQLCVNYEIVGLRKNEDIKED